MSTTIDVNYENPENKQRKLEFSFNRAACIEIYASLENAIFIFYCDLIGLDSKKASIFYWNITSARNRTVVFEKALKLTDPITSNLFRNSILKRIGKLNTMRNKIVHYLVVGNHSADGSATPILMKPDFFYAENPTEITNSDLREFIAETDFIMRNINVLHGLISATRDNAESKMFEQHLGIFQQPLPFPIPADHPLNPNPEKQPKPPQS